VRWTAPANDGGSAVTGYRVRVVDAAGAQVGTLRSATAGARSLVVTGLVNGRAYRFQVAAVNAAGTSAYSARSNSLTPVGVASAPRIGTASSGTAGGAVNAVARWNPPTNTGGSALTGYQVVAVRMSSSATNATVLSRRTSAVLAAGSRSYTFALPAGTYRFEIVARNARGTSPASARSNAVLAR
jgi:hypothetical protein